MKLSFVPKKDHWQKSEIAVLKKPKDPSSFSLMTMWSANKAGFERLRGSLVLPVLLEGLAGLRSFAPNIDVIVTYSDIVGRKYCTITLFSDGNVICLGALQARELGRLERVMRTAIIRAKLIILRLVIWLSVKIFLIS